MARKIGKSAWSSLANRNHKKRKGLIREEDLEEEKEQNEDYASEHELTEDKE